MKFKVCSLVVTTHLISNRCGCAFSIGAHKPNISTKQNYFAIAAHNNKSTSHVVSSKTPVSKKKSNNKKNNHMKSPKKKLPDAELVNRRKSPALWREDLTLATTTGRDERTNSRPRAPPLLPKRPPEVMAPCGGFPQLKAAVANGADSVYLGLTAFSARARASNFSPEELIRAVDVAHSSGVKVYVALNTLVFQDELREVAEWIRVCDDAGVDALIVQDVGVTKLARAIAPELEIHASTQQTVTNTDGVLYAKDRGGATRVVLGRELSVADIESITNDLDEENEHVEVEAFVHGALCVSYSGQCFSSEAWGGRSANRGQCAQACRLPYGLIRDGELIDLQDMTYLLSPQDLCGIDQVEDLVRAGVGCLKIEGRLKDEHYVAATTRAYRNAVDSAWEKITRERNNDDDGTVDDDIVRRTKVLNSHETVSKTELAQLFSRGQDESHDGLSPGFFQGSQHQRLVRGRSPRHRGIHLGRVVEGSSPHTGIVMRCDDDPTSSSLKRGDGIVIDRGMPQEFELGGPVFDVKENYDGTVVVRFSKAVEKEWKKKDDAARKGVRESKKPLAPPGSHVWKTSDAAVDKKMRKLIECEVPKCLVEVTVGGQIGAPLTVEINDLATGKVGVGKSEGLLVQSEQTGIDETSVRKAIGLLGNTKWKLQDSEKNIDLSGLNADAWCPISWVKKARQKAVQDLIDQNPASESFDDGQVVNDYFKENNSRSAIVDEVISELIGSVPVDSEAKNYTVAVLARNQQQVETLGEMIESGIKVDEVIIDFLEVDGMKEAVSRVRRTNKSVTVVVATPRIIKPGEEGIWKTLLRIEPDGLLVRAAGLVHKLTSLGGHGANIDVGNGQIVRVPQLIGDFSLNAINTITSSELLEYGGLSRITAGYDLSANAITELAKAMNGAATRLEVVAHTHLPIFHTEHCVFARFLTKGNSYLDCGHVCTRVNSVHLRDQTGKDNLVLADMGCRNTVFSSKAQSGVHSLKDWSKAGVGTFRIELVDEQREDVEKIVNGYLDVLNGKQTASDVWDMLKSIKDSNGREGGVSHGSLRNTSERRAGELSVDQGYF